MTPRASTVSDRTAAPVAGSARSGLGGSHAPGSPARPPVTPGAPARPPVAVSIPASPAALGIAPIPAELADQGTPTARRGELAGRIRAYVSLTKPRIVELLLVTTVPTMMLAAGGLPPLWLVAVVLVGGSLAAGSANALNCYIDRDIDQVMRRTSRRPLPTHTVSPRSALVFGLVLGVVAVGLMAAFTNALATGLTLAAIVYYDLVYTMWLKRTTSQNTVWGGACGAAPVLIGWAAVTGSLSPEAWVLFAVVFLWQPPHFYALAIKFKNDYARAGIPMLSVVASPTRVAVESVIYAWLTLAASLLLWWPLGAGPLYGVPALVTGALFVRQAHLLYGRARRGEPLRPMALFHWSTTYLTILFVAVAVTAFG